MADDLCRSFIEISEEVWDLMKRAQNVRNPSRAKNATSWGMRLKETTLTDYVVLRLLEKCGGTVNVFTFTQRSEANVGADMEMWLTDANNNWLGLRIQCKVIEPHHTCFNELHYKTKSGEFQSDILINKSKGLLPVYLLYIGPDLWTLSKLLTKEHIINSIPCSCCTERYLFFGNWLISAYRVKYLRPQNHLKDLWPYMCPWQCLVCLCRITTSVRGIKSVLENLYRTVFYHDKAQIQIDVTNRPPEYVTLALEGRLPDTVEQLDQLLEGHEMRHLAIVRLE